MPNRKTQNNNAVVAVFQDRASAERAVSQLRTAGFSDSEIGLVAKSASGDVVTKDGSGETLAEEGAVSGAAVGAAAGGLIGLGVLSGFIPVIGPAIMAGTLGTILSNAAAGAAIAGLTGALIGFGIPEEDAAYYEGEVQAGRYLVTVNASGDRASEAWNILHGHGAYNRATPAVSTATSHTASSHTAAHTAGATTAARGTAGGTMQLKEEQLRVSKQQVQTGEVEVRKEVHTEHKQITVPVEREEIVIERRAVSGAAGTHTGDIKAEEIRIPVKEERVNVSKETVVKEEVSVGKRKVHDTETVTGDVRKEEIKIEEEGDVSLRTTGSSKSRKKS